MKRKILLVALLWLIFFNPGSATSIDTNRRIQMAHAWWTGTEEGIPGDSLIINVNDKNYIPYDLGQSMLILPGDWLGTKLSQNLNLSRAESQKFTEAFISFFVFIPIALWATFACFRLLKLFGYSENIAGLSSIVWLLGTSVLFYAGFHQQNTQILLFLLISYGNALAYSIKPQKKLLILSGMALGITFLIRITSVLHLVGILLFIIGCTYNSKKSRAISHSIKAINFWAMGFIPFAILERIFTYFRYGSWTTTSISMHLQTFANQASVATGEIAKGSPETLWIFKLLTKVKLEALLAPLISPEKSIFLYDLLLIPCVILLIICWKKLAQPIKLFLIALFVDFLLHLYLYSWTNEWILQEAWGARYHLTAVQLFMIPLIPLLVRGATTTISHSRHRSQIVCSWLAKIVIVLAVLIMFSSHLLPSNLEVLQQKMGVGSRFRLVQRLHNIITVSHYKPDSNLQLTQIIKYNPEFAFEGKVTWDLFPFRFRNKIAPNSRLQKLVPILFIFWVSLFIFATTTTIYFFKT